MKQESPFKCKPPPSYPTALLFVVYKYLCPISGLSDELPELKLNKHPQKKLITLLSVQKNPKPTAYSIGMVRADSGNIKYFRL